MTRSIADVCTIHMLHASVPLSVFTATVGGSLFSIDPVCDLSDMKDVLFFISERLLGATTGF